MADKWPLANGNWSNAANWNDGTKPLSVDDVYADGKTVAIDESVTVASIRTTQRSGGTNGGGFTWNSSLVPTIIADIYTGNGITLNQSGGPWLLIGNVFGSETSGQPGIQYAGTGQVTGNITQGASGGPTINAVNAGVAVTVVGNLTATNAVGGFGAPGCCVRTRGSVTITGNVSCTAPSTGAAIYVVDSQSNVTVIVNGTIHSGGVPAIVIANTSGVTTLNINGNVTGVTPISSYSTHPVRIQTHSTTPISLSFPTWNTAGTRTFYTGGVNLGQPLPANVRFGTQFGASNEYTGTLRVPAPQYVNAGVLTDNTVGTFLFDLQPVTDAILAKLPTTGRAVSDAEYFNQTKLAAIEAINVTMLNDPNNQDLKAL